MGMGAPTPAIIRITTTPMNECCDWLPNLMTWLSPAYPVGAYSYSHGLEWAVELGAVRTAADLVEYVGGVIEFGAGWSDLILAAAAWGAMKSGRRDELDRLAQLGLALRPTSEFALESLQQGTAFASTTRAAWPHAAFDAFVEAHPEGVVYPVAVGAACARCAPLEATLLALGHSIASNLVSAGLRLIPLGQTDGQRAISTLAPKIAAVARTAKSAELVDIGTAVPAIEGFSMRHETQYTRLFRS
jgi:urease accessory protein